MTGIGLDEGGSISSPDPLGTSLTISSSPSKLLPKAANWAPTQKARTSNAGTGQPKSQLRNMMLVTPPRGRRALSVSPTKSSMRLENTNSPWRIRVTVEAEQDSDDGAEDQKKSISREILSPLASPLQKQRSRSVKGPREISHTTTTTVPVKGLESSPPVKRGRGRPRKSETPVKRNGTPAPKARGRRKTTGEVSEPLLDLQDSTTKKTPPKSGRGQRRKSNLVSVSDVRVNEQPSEMEPPASESLATLLPTARARRGRRKEMSPVNIAVDPELEAVDDIDWVEASKHSPIKNGVGTALSDIQLNQALIHSAGSEAAMLKELGAKPDVLEKERNNGSSLQTQREKSSPAKKTPVKSNRTGKDVSGSAGHQQESLNAPVSSNSPGVVPVPAGMHSVLPSSRHVESTEDRQTNVKQLHERVDISQMREFDSVLESEGFSMISTASLPSIKEQSSSPYSQDGSIDLVNVSTNGRSTYIEKGSELPHDSGRVKSAAQRSQQRTYERSAHEEHPKPISRTTNSFPSSPPNREPRRTELASTSRHETPSIALSSPSLPPPIEQALPRDSNSGNGAGPKPRMSPAVRAGKALQGALDTFQESKLSSSSGLSKADNLSVLPDGIDPFSGFSQGTRRELDAGLRLGLDLARGQQIKQPRRGLNQIGTELARAEDDVFGGQTKGGPYPELPTPEDSDEYSLSLPLIRPAPYPRLPNDSLALSSHQQTQDLQNESDLMDWQHESPERYRTPSSSTKAARRLSDELGKDYQQSGDRIAERAEKIKSKEIIMISSNCDSSSTMDTTYNGVDAGSLNRVEDNAAGEISDRSRVSDDEVDLPRALVGPTIVKPPRGKIPSPWRRASNSAFIYSDETSMNESNASRSDDTIEQGKTPSPSSEVEQNLQATKHQIQTVEIRSLPKEDGAPQEPTKKRAIIPFRKSTTPTEVLPYPRLDEPCRQEGRGTARRIVRESSSGSMESDETSNEAKGDNKEAQVETGGYLSRLLQMVSVGLPATKAAPPAPTISSTKPAPRPTDRPKFRSRAEFDAYFPPPPLPASPLPTDRWSTTHWDALAAFRDHYKTWPIPYPENVTSHPLIGRCMMSRDGRWAHNLTCKDIALAIEFRQKGLQRGGVWGTEYLCRKIFALIVGDSVREEREGRVVFETAEERRKREMEQSEDDSVLEEGLTGVDGIEAAAV